VAIIDVNKDKLLAALYVNGLSTFEVAAAAQVTVGRVNRALDRTNTPRRTQHEARKLAQSRKAKQP
jgi:hypothetical protein